MKTLNQKAFHLRTKLFSLVNEFRDLQSAFIGADCDVDLRIEASSQIDDAAYKLAKIHQQLGDVFIDASRDAKDQSFAVQA